MSLLKGHREALDKIADFLIEKETITGKEFMEIFHQVENPEPEEAEAEVSVNPEDTAEIAEPAESAEPTELAEPAETESQDDEPVQE